MITTFNSRAAIEKLDRDGVLESADLLAEQLRSSWEDFKRVRVPSSYKNVERIVVTGMGGSALGPHIIQSLFSDSMRVPFQITNGYQLPASVDAKTLYVLSSYSGTTEESLSTYQAAKRRGAKLFGLCSGGTIGAWIKKGELPGFVFRIDANPSGQPRMGLGFSLGAQLGLFSSLGVISLSDASVRAQLTAIEKWKKAFGPDVPERKNPAKKIARAFHGRIPLLIGAEFLTGNVHTMTNQINENAKAFAQYFLLPEIDHHLIEGLRFPKNFGASSAAVFLNSAQYHPKTQRRFAITKTIFSKHKIPVLEHRLTAPDRIGQSFELLTLGTYVSIYLAVLNGVNPAPIPWVDYLKKELKKNS